MTNRGLLNIVMIIAMKRDFELIWISLKLYIMNDFKEQ